MAVDILLKLDGVKGESKIDEHKEEIDVLSWSWGASQSGTTHTGSGGGSGKVAVQDVHITKYLDAASSTIMRFCCNGKHVAKGTLLVRKAGEKPVDYLKLDMEEIIITSVTTGGSGGEDRLTENISLNFAKFKFEYFTQEDSGSKGKSAPLSWDIAANKAA
ncbi:Hcp family type VI secretion system effector [Lichenifustis flavocetrariae]|uniref:Type VI secretion system tube protein Hcp n=1 Tax=Lichenifustis flavocetrariae TaxID=2949735 RepID=A0AA41YYC3_9HYPH|nr:type VI secretion system tube protein Hcp [Lichenifustis flavocetrariae]MCW6509313.1 type VI secretion system tube protein Hcp [Lichenifustis flavocetrariae]